MIPSTKKVFYSASVILFLMTHLINAAETTEFSGILRLQDFTEVSLASTPKSSAVATQSYIPYLSILIFLFIPACTIQNKSSSISS